MATGQPPKGVQVGTPVTTAMATRSKQRKQDQLLLLEALPDVVKDKVLGYLSPEDLRRFHQVSKAWQNTLVSRKRFNERRLELVHRIRLNKENIARGNLLESATPNARGTTDVRNNDGKPGGRRLLNPVITNTNSAPTTRPEIKPRGITTSTPSRFNRRLEAGKKLLPGQKLFNCPKCESPVPSPVSSIRSTFGLQRRLANFSKQISLSSPSLTHDSGFESIEESADSHQVSFSDSQEEEFSTGEICISLIATPEPDKDKTWSRRESPLQTPYEELNTEDFTSSSSYHEDNTDTDIAQCPDCSHRFCCKCQCTAHPGKPCKEIDGDTTSSVDLPALFRSDTKDTTKSDRKRSKNSLRRLARL